MRSLIAVVVVLATSQAVFGQFAPQVKVLNSYLSSVVRAENELLAPLAPFGRKLSQDPLTPLVVKGNAEGSIFYTPGNFFNPTLIAEAITGMTSLPTFGRKLTQDPYMLIPKANVVASILSGNVLPGYGRKMQETEQPKAEQWDVEAIHQALGFSGPSRKLSQDTLAANYLGSVVVGGVTLTDEALHLPTGRKLLDYRTGYGFPYGTGSKTVQDNAAASILADPSKAYDPILDRKLFLGFNADEPHKRHLKEDDAEYASPVHAALGWAAPKN